TVDLSASQPLHFSTGRPRNLSGGDEQNVIQHELAGLINGLADGVLQTRRDCPDSRLNLLHQHHAISILRGQAEGGTAALAQDRINGLSGILNLAGKKLPPIDNDRLLHPTSDHQTIVRKESQISGAEISLTIVRAFPEILG